jgi:hypothetical protein
MLTNSCLKDDECRSIRMALNTNRPVLEEMWDIESDMETDDVSESEDEEREGITAVR